MRFGPEKKGYGRENQMFGHFRKKRVIFIQLKYIF